MAVQTTSTPQNVPCTRTYTHYWKVQNDDEATRSVYNLRVKYILSMGKIQKFIQFWLNSKGQNEFMRSSFLPKCQPKVTKISAALEVY